MKLLKNNKGQIGMIGAIFLFLMFILNWFLWLGTWLTSVGTTAVSSNGLTGVEAFFLSNLNFVVLVVMILAMIGWSYFSVASA